ncbi:MAG: hypothetical protein U0232_31490 [Thermomicrobiales bacterium]
MTRRNRIVSFLLGLTLATSLTLGVVWGGQPVNRAEAPHAIQAQGSVIWGTRS